MRRQACWILLFCLVLSVPVSCLSAADDTKPPVKPAAPPTKPDDAWQRLIYVPYRAIKSVLEDPHASAIVPLDEYLRLWQSGTAIPIRIPLGAVVTEAHYVAKVEKDLVRTQATLTIVSVEKNWSQANVNFGEAAIGKIATDNKSLLTRGLGRGMYAFLVPAAGTYKVDLELSTPVRNSPDGRSFDLDCPTVGITTFELSIPEADQTIDLTPAAVVQPVEGDKKSTHIKVNLAATPRITARWHPRVSTRPEMQLLTGVENVLRVGIGEGIVHTDAALTYKVFRGELAQLRLAVPTGDRILDVSSPQGALRSWRAVVEPNRQLVIVDLLADTSKEITIEVHTERSLPADGFDVAGVDEKGRPFGIHAVDVVRESGQLILSHREGVDVAVQSEHGLVRVDAAEVAAADRKPDSIFYKFYSPAIRLRLEARPVEPQIAVVNRSQIVFSDDELRLTAKLRYEVTRTGVFELGLRIPDGLTIDTVESAAMKAYHLDAAAHRLVVTLNQKQQGTIELVVNAHRDLKDAAGIDLPLIEPANVFREDGFVEAFAPEGIELTSDEGKLTGAHPEPPSNITAPPNTHRAGAWSYHHRPVTIPVKTVRKPTRLTARVGTLVSVQQESAAVVSKIEFDVENAGIDTFRIAVPEPVADKVQLQAEGETVGIKQQSRDEKAVDGWVAWTIVLQRKVTGRHRFTVKYDLKPTAVPAATPAAAGAAKPESPDVKAGGSTKAELVVALPQPMGLKNADGSEKVPLTRIEGEAAVLKDRALSVTAAATGGDVEAIDVRELKQLGHTGYLAYRYEKQPVQLKLSIVKYGVQQVVETVVSRALVETVVGRDASALYRCRYVIKSSQRQRLPIDLPAGSTPLGVFLDGKPTALETSPAAAKSEAWTAYFVNLVRSKPSDEPIVLAVQFRRPINPAPFESLGGGLQLEFPRIGGASGEGVVVQQLRAAVWVPSKYVLVRTPEGFVPESGTNQPTGRLAVAAVGPSAAELDGWIGGNRDSLIEFPVEGNGYVYSRLGPAEKIAVTWVNMMTYTVVISLAIAIVAFLLRRSRWETLATLVLTVALAATLLALLDGELVWHALLAARYGLVALVALWLIEGFRRTTQRPSTARPSPSAPPPAAASVAGPADGPAGKEA